AVERASAERLDGEGGWTARLRFLYRVQRAQDAAYGVDRAGYHGRAWRDLSCHGRADSLLWRHSIAHGRHRGVGACGDELARQAGRRQDRRHLLVCELSRPVHGNNNTYNRESEGVAAVRDDALHAVS